VTRKTKFTYPIDVPAGRALHAFFGKSEGKELTSEIKRDVIRSLVLNKDWNVATMIFKGKEFPVLVEYIRQRAAANDRAFFKGLGRALTEPRKFKNTLIGDFLFQNWDATEGSLAKGPGLKHFTDEAVVKLLEILFGDDAPSLSAYRDIRKAAGLRPERPAKIREVKLDTDSMIVLIS
jgi:hypothetical protein